MSLYFSLQYLLFNIKRVPSQFIWELCHFQCHLLDQRRNISIWHKLIPYQTKKLSCIFEYMFEKTSTKNIHCSNSSNYVLIQRLIIILFPNSHQEEDRHLVNKIWSYRGIERNPKGYQQGMEMGTPNVCFLKFYSVNNWRTTSA